MQPTTTSTSAIPDPIAAVTAADPYPYYASLRASPCYRDERLKLWVATDAAAADAALTHPGLYVRPQAEPVPGAIAATPAGTLFGKLARIGGGLPDGMISHINQRLLRLLLLIQRDDARNPLG